MLGIIEICARMYAYINYVRILRMNFETGGTARTRCHNIILALVFCKI